MEKAKNPIGEDLKTARKARKVSVPRLALALDIPKDRIYKWEQGVSSPGYEDRLKVEAWLKNGNWKEIPRETVVTSEAGKEIGEIREELILLKASVRIFGMNMAELLAAKNRTSVTKASLELEQTISEEVNRLWLEVNKR